jgi:hypothetical protein
MARVGMTAAQDSLLLDHDKFLSVGQQGHVRFGPHRAYCQIVKLDDENIVVELLRRIYESGWLKYRIGHTVTVRRYGRAGWTRDNCFEVSEIYDDFIGRSEEV